ncbi:MAG: hypothetical protein V4504_01125 [Patescibacteria group bacterium]
MSGEKSEENNPIQVSNGLASFFDLLAYFDFQDKQKEKSVLNSNALASAPRVLELGPEL